MRTSTLSRSVMAVASLAIGSAAFAAVPASADTQNGVTREEVLAAASSLRADTLKQIDPSTPTQSALDTLATKVCGQPVDGTYGQPVRTPDSVDGLAVVAFLASPIASPTLRPTVQTCTFTAVATIDGATTFTGEARVTSRSYSSGPIIIEDTDAKSLSAASRYNYSDLVFPLTGNVFVSPALISSDYYPATEVAASGLVKSPSSKRVLTSVKIADTKTKSERKAAKKAYVKRIKAVKKSYAKAKRRAGSNAEKKAVARTKYSARKASAKAAYSYSIADYKLVNRRTATSDERRFSVDASIDLD